MFQTGDYPFQSDSTENWDRLIESVGPASVLVLIRSWMGAKLLRHLSAEDIWQETLLQAWRDRKNLQWMGLAGFRLWLLQIARNRIRNAVDHWSAVKRGSGSPETNFSEQGSSFSPVGSTTPGRLAVWKEQAETMHAALEKLPDEFREILRLRLFEEISLSEIAEKLGMPLSTVKYRFWKGADVYRTRLVGELRSRPGDSHLLSSRASETSS